MIKRIPCVDAQILGIGGDIVQNMLKQFFLTTEDEATPPAEKFC